MTTVELPAKFRAEKDALRRATLALSAAMLAAALALSVCDEARAQTKSEPAPVPHGKSQLKGQPKQPAETPAKPNLPAPEQMAIMIQTSVVALSQANLTGNFTVLHALGAPGFQQANPPAKLAEVFKNLREQNIDLTPVILFAPLLLREPAINAQGMLHLVGYYKTAPQQVQFELLFQPVAGQWRLFGISVRTAPAAAASNQPPAGSSPAANAPAASPPAGSPPAAASTTDPNKKKK